MVGESPARLARLLAAHAAGRRPPRQYNMDDCEDLNGVQFVSMPVLRLLLAFADQLPPGWLAARMATLELAAVAAIAEANSEATPYYTK